MPSNLPSSFASAAARMDGRGNNSGEWARPARSNGTLTFRRSSTTPSGQSMPATGDPAVISAMPVGSTAIENSSPQRYTREELLSIFNMAQDSHSQQPDVSSLYVEGWTPGNANGAQARGWGKTGDSHVVPQDPDICWDAPGTTKAVGLQQMTPEEKDLFHSDVNSTMKPPVQNKDGNHPAGGLNGRKTSLSHNVPSAFGVSSPSAASRPGTRRRETTDTNPYSAGGLMSPTSATRPSRDDPNYWFGRKNADMKDSMYEEPEEETEPREAPTKPLPFGGLMRNNTTPSGSGFGTPSPWQAPISGMGAFGNFALPSSSAIGEKRPGNPRGESRLAHLIPKDSSESMGGKSKEGSAGTDANRSWRPRPRTDTDPFGGEESLSGSAVLGGAQDTSPPPMTHPPLQTQSFDTPIKGSVGDFGSDFGMSGLNLHEHTPMSPAETNPYRSPPADRGEQEGVGEKSHTSGPGAEPSSNFGGGVPRSFAHAAFDGSDRSQTSSVGAKPYPTLGNLTGWPSSSTPDRERAPFAGFGGSLFGSVGDLSSPGLGNLGGVFGPATTGGIGGSGSFGRASKLGSLFPPAMQSQMAAHENESLGDSMPDMRQTNPLGAIGRNTESPMRAGRGVFADMISQADAKRTPGSSEAFRGGALAGAPGQGFPGATNAPGYQPGQGPDPPSAQIRTMVMPDRMRWVYLDPQGQQQGPFTGLEMNDWYKANFFTPDLRVKKLEDSEFEPLGQLIRRIGNSREPFIVPQIGVAHGPPAAGNMFSPSAGAVPPLVGAFPSFGRTLTAEEQNNLERRKQEEQYLMARQREYLSGQQTMARAQVPGVPGLTHHSSAHSLHSQPSFGSMTSPIAMPPQPPIGAIGSSGSFFDQLVARQPPGHGSSGPSLDMFHEDELSRLSGPERQVLANLSGSGSVVGGNLPPQPIGMPSSSADSGLRSQLPAGSELAEDPEGFRGRLREFEQLRAQHDAEQMEQQRQMSSSSRGGHGEASATEMNAATGAAEPQQPLPDESSDIESPRTQPKSGDAVTTSKEFKAYQQAQAKAAAAKLSGLPMPFPPPPQSSTPLPAPAPQRVKSNLPEQYASSRSGTPDVTSTTSSQPPPLAPWAKDGGAESHKGPSLKEIQEAEARKAAKADEAASAARRAMMEQEAAREREKSTVAAPGLPTSSTWGAGSPVSASATASPWSKPAAVKTAAPGLSAAAQAADKKKTLADIQREEEARKQKAKEVAAQTGVASSAGKRYADLASKTNAAALSGPPTNASSPTGSNASGWATVGAGGKVKVPTGPASQARPGSSTNVKPAAAAVAAAPSPRPPVKTVSSTSGTGRSEAMDEFNKWLHNQLTRGITGVTDIDNFASSLLALPLMPDIISDAIYASSKTMDGRHFAQEFIRRKKLADKGVVERQPANSPSGDLQSSSTGGWNEVARKSNHKESASGDANAMQGAGFKVVPGRKKGKK
ncbi:hypothetical protein F4780DRAFT_765908 [Xylariomycetidae sp. FL0641]|nr:hypothetical protein F4780DRAFT_765908 [Xylariomycetidae sp. FL0641]